MDPAATTAGLRRLANIHIMRTAGTYVNEYLCRALGPDCCLYNSWLLDLNRDWTEEEAWGFAELEGAVYVHNHVVTWNCEAVQRYLRAGFFLFTFVRDVGDQLCSLYYWMKSRVEIPADLSLSEFLQIQLSGGQVSGVGYRYWEIPPYWRLLDYVEVFSQERFERFVQEELGMEWDKLAGEAAGRNGSESLGYRDYCAAGEINRATQRLLEKSVFQRRFLAIQSD